MSEVIKTCKCGHHIDLHDDQAVCRALVDGHKSCQCMQYSTAWPDEPLERQKMKYRCEAKRVDATTWMVRRWDEHDNMDEALLRGCPDNWDDKDAINDAVHRGSWA